MAFLEHCLGDVVLSLLHTCANLSPLFLVPSFNKKNHVEVIVLHCPEYFFK